MDKDTKLQILHFVKELGYTEISKVIRIAHIVEDYMNDKKFIGDPVSFTKGIGAYKVEDTQ